METELNADGSVTLKVFIHADVQYPRLYSIFVWDANGSGYALLDTVEVKWAPPKQEAVIPIVVHALQEKISEVQAEAQSRITLLNEQIQKLLSIGYTDTTSS